MSSPSVIITRPNHDLLTHYLCIWTEDVVKLAKTKCKALDLKGEKATKENFESYIVKHQPRFIFLNGHGNEFEVTGYENKTLVKVGTNEYLLANKIVYARSCEAAKILGVSVVNNHSATFIGYQKNYILARNPSKAMEPLKDEVAKLFIEPSNLVASSIIKGNTAKEAFNKSQQAMKKNFTFMLSSAATSNQRDAASYLWANIRNQVIMGDETAKL